LKGPNQRLVKFISHHQIVNQRREDATLLNLHEADQYKKQHLAHSVIAAFFSRRIALIMFDRSKPLLIFCEDGNSSEVAAFLILKNKLNTLSVMRGMAYEAESRPTDTQTLN